MKTKYKTKYKAISNKYVFYDNCLERLISRIKQTDKRLKYYIIGNNQKKIAVVYRKNIIIFAA